MLIICAQVGRASGEGITVEVKDVLVELMTPRTVYLNSSLVLTEGVDKAAGKLDERLSKKGMDLPRRKRMEPLPRREVPVSIEVTPWEVLHRLGRATVLSGQGASRGLAEHWGCLKYCQALRGHADGRGAMALTDEALRQVHHHKTVQSEELGIGFALVAAMRILTRRLPNHTLTVIDADVALQAGWAITGLQVANRDEVKLRPDYFIEARPERGPSTVIVLECKGTHGDYRYACHQLAKASSQVDAVHLAGRGALPSLAIAAELKAKAGITLHALDPDGDGTLELVDDDPDRALNSEVRELNIVPHFEVPLEDAEGRIRTSVISGFRIGTEQDGWFRKVLARTTAAGLMAFCGERGGAAPYLTKRQGAGRFTERVLAGTGSVQDVSNRIRGIRFVGTDQVFRIGGVRVEAFSGVAEPLFDRLTNGDVASYRRQSPEVFETWTERGERGEQEWDGPVSVDADGSIMALRLVVG